MVNKDANNADINPDTTPGSMVASTDDITKNIPGTIITPNKSSDQLKGRRVMRGSKTAVINDVEAIHNTAIEALPNLTARKNVTQWKARNIPTSKIGILC